MFADSLKADKLIAVTLLKEGWEEEKEPYPAYDIAGVGFIRAAVANDDGTSNVILHGISRIKILSYIQDEPYRLAEVKELEDEILIDEEIKKLSQKLKELFVKKVKFLSETPQDTFPDFAELDDPAVLTNWAAYTAYLDHHEKQKLLEMVTIKARLRRLIKILEAELFPPNTRN